MSLRGSVKFRPCGFVVTTFSLREEYGLQVYNIKVGKIFVCRWVDNIRMDLQEVGCGYVDWIGLAQDRDGWRKLVSAVMNLRVP